MGNVWGRCSGVSAGCASLVAGLVTEWSALGRCQSPRLKQRLTDLLFDNERKALDYTDTAHVDVHGAYVSSNTDAVWASGLCQP